MKKPWPIVTLLLLVFSWAAPVLAQTAPVNRIVNITGGLAVPIPEMPAFSDASYGADTGGNPTVSVPWIAEYIVAIYRYGISIIGIAAVIGIAIGGVYWVVSGGNSGRISTAKAWIQDSLLGLAIALSSYLILAVLNKDLTIFKSVNLATIGRQELDFTSGGGEGINLQQYQGKASFNTPKNDYDELLKKYAQMYDVDCTLAKAQMMAESGGNPGLTSPKNAQGLMQMLPSTASGNELKAPAGVNLFDPETSINYGIKYMSLLKTDCCNGNASNNVCNCSGDIKYRIAAYNAGRGRNIEILKCLGMTRWECEIPETRNYVSTVKANYQKLIDNNWGC